MPTDSVPLTAGAEAHAGGVEPLQSMVLLVNVYLLPPAVSVMVWPVAGLVGLVAATPMVPLVREPELLLVKPAPSACTGAPLAPGRAELAGALARRVRAHGAGRHPAPGPGRLRRRPSRGG